MYVFWEYMIKIFQTTTGLASMVHISVGASFYSLLLENLCVLIQLNALKYWEQTFCSFAFILIRFTCIDMCGIVWQEQLNCEKTAFIHYIILVWKLYLHFYTI